MNDDHIKLMKKNKFKKMMKQNIRDEVFKVLTEKQKSHSKIKHVMYDKLKLH